MRRMTILLRCSALLFACALFALTKKHLQQAFDRKQNVIAGEHMPDPSEDDSFVPYKNDKEFWAFVTSLK
jgi:hypothetical protein